LDRKPYTWGDAPNGDGGTWHANAYQGRFPAAGHRRDGFAGLAPVRSFPPNGYGLYDMSGNAWECAPTGTTRTTTPRRRGRTRAGPERGAIVPPEDEPQKVRRGGSFLCDDRYCRRYLPSARDKNPTDSCANHTGFRCVRDVR
jgi:formylglycine-generating enzyme required for sulfatase activity